MGILHNMMKDAGRRESVMVDKLARVRWEMGQTLLPGHLVAQEESLVADMVLRFRMLGLPAYGIARLKWNETFLSEGVFSIQSMTAVAPSGLLIDVRANAAVSPFNLNIPGTTTVPVYCHVVKYSAVEEEDASAAGMDGSIHRNVWQLALSSEQGHLEALETIKLAEFEKNPEGVWKLSGSYIPPLLQVGSSPFLLGEIEELGQALELFHYKVTQEIAASYLSGDSMFSAKECLKSTLRIQRFIANHLAEIHLHPYYLYEELKNFHTEVCFYRDTIPEHVAEVYGHDRLSSCFANVLEPLRQQMSMIHSKSPYLPFEMRDGIYRLGLPPEVREAKEVYFLVQKSHVNTKASIEGIKMAGLARLPLIHKLALFGIPLTKIERPPFQHRFGPEVDFYVIAEGEEWDRALRELVIAFYDSSKYRDLRFYLYWRLS